jgi:hypothetical protein
MLYKKFVLPTDEIGEALSQFAIGFCHLHVENGVENIKSAGSGTLVTGRIDTRYSHSGPCD